MFLLFLFFCTICTQFFLDDHVIATNVLGFEYLFFPRAPYGSEPDYYTSRSRIFFCDSDFYILSASNSSSSLLRFSRLSSSDPWGPQGAMGVPAGFQGNPDVFFNSAAIACRGPVLVLGQPEPRLLSVFVNGTLTSAFRVDQIDCPLFGYSLRLFGGVDGAAYLAVGCPKKQGSNGVNRRGGVALFRANEERSRFSLDYTRVFMFSTPLGGNPGQLFTAPNLMAAIGSPPLLLASSQDAHNWYVQPYAGESLPSPLGSMPLSGGVKVICASRDSELVALAPQDVAAHGWVHIYENSGASFSLRMVLTPPALSEAEFPVGTLAMSPLGNLLAVGMPCNGSSVDMMRVALFQRENSSAVSFKYLQTLYGICLVEFTDEDQLVTTGPVDVPPALRSLRIGCAGIRQGVNGICVSCNVSLGEFSPRDGVCAPCYGLSGGLDEPWRCDRLCREDEVTLGPQGNATGCAPCLGGTVDLLGDGLCHCPSGHVFEPQGGGGTCIPCLGSLSADGLMCTSCSNGSFVPTLGNCSTCYGTLVSEDSSLCLPCVAGFAAVRPGICVACPAGLVSANGRFCVDPNVSSGSAGESDSASSLSASVVAAIAAVGGGGFLVICLLAFLLSICISLLLCCLLSFLLIFIVFLVVMAVLLLTLVIGGVATWRLRVTQQRTFDLSKFENYAGEEVADGLDRQFRELAFSDLGFDRLVGQGAFGSGAFGSVYLGTWRSTTVVAIKELRPPTLDVAVSRAEYVQEANVMAHVDTHPNVVHFIGAVTTEENFYIVSEFARGGSLLDLLRGFGGSILPWPRRLTLLTGCAAGICHLHADGIVHRDIAARNFLLLDGDSDNVFVTDFGLSRVMKREEEVEGEDVQQTTESNVGPVRWMAPESLAKKGYSTKSDVYMFGCLIYEIETGGEEPFKDFSPVDVVHKVTILQKRPEIPPTTNVLLAELMNATWRENPEERPSMKRVYQSLAREEALSQLGTTSTKPGIEDNSHNSSNSEKFELSGVGEYVDVDAVSYEESVKREKLKSDGNSERVRTDSEYVDVVGTMSYGESFLQ